MLCVYIYTQTHTFIWGFPGGASGTEFACRSRSCKGCRFDPWVRKIPWSRKWQQVILPRKCHGQAIVHVYQATIHGAAKSRTWLRDLHFHFPQLYCLHKEVGEGLESLPSDPVTSLRGSRVLNCSGTQRRFAPIRPLLPFLALFWPLARIMGKCWQQYTENSSWGGRGCGVTEGHNFSFLGRFTH